MTSMRKILLGLLLLLTANRELLAAPLSKREQASQIVCARLNEFKNALNPDQRGRVTIAVGMTLDGKILIATSETERQLRRELRPLVRPGDEVITNQYPDKLHAEEKIVRRAGTTLYVIAASWSICALCQSLIDGVHALPVTRCRSDPNPPRRTPKAGKAEPEPEPESEPQDEPPADE